MFSDMTLDELEIVHEYLEDKISLLQDEDFEIIQEIKERQKKLSRKEIENV